MKPAFPAMRGQMRKREYDAAMVALSPVPQVAFSERGGRARPLNLTYRPKAHPAAKRAA